MLNKDFDDFYGSHKQEAAQSNPHYNIEKTAFNTYEVTLAVPGFKKSDLDVSFKDGVLKVKGLKENIKTSSDFLHQGFIINEFENNFALSTSLEVTLASLRDGLLIITLTDKSLLKDPITALN